MKYQAITAPEWLARNAIYQINPRTFSPEGTIAAVTKELPALKELGFRIMYLCPIFEEDDSEVQAFWSERQKKSGTLNPKNPYRMNDYFTVDSEYGTMEDLRAFIAEAHRLGMRVLLDLVYLHIGPNAPILKRHPEFAKQDQNGNIILTSWHFPYLDYTCPGLREYLWCNMVYYVGELDVDGFRCDVGDGVPLDFWNEGRRRMQAIKPDSILLNEGSNLNSLLTAFDACYFFDWHEKLYAAFGGTGSPYSEAGHEPLRELREVDERMRRERPAGALLLRDIDNHDTVTDWPRRAELVAGHDGMELIEVINYLIDGIPMVYCGNELADTGKLSMFANRFHMGRFEVTDRSIAANVPGLRRQKIIRQLNTLKREHDVLRYGTTRWLDTGECDRVIAFEREYLGSKITLIGNVTAEAVAVSLPVDLPAPTLMERGSHISDGQIILEPHGYRVLEYIDA
ncbi:MAG: alpha-amylase family glycosyl hydrolase [Eubacteriales bacterium]|nr:alpha-amylase family glycosyl hydrolase [Eubacteriales bacterium]